MSSDAGADAGVSTVIHGHVEARGAGAGAGKEINTDGYVAVGVVTSAHTTLGIGVGINGAITEVIVYWEPFQAWEMWPSPHSEKPVGSKVGGQDPRPWTGSPVGNQACIVPRLL